MQLTVIEAVCETGGANNEDIWGQAGGVVWVMDGATGLSDHPLIAGPSDAAWFVGQVDAGLRTALAEPVATQAALVQAVRATAHAAKGLSDTSGVGHHELPCASFVAVRRVDEETLEFANLGDCKLLWREGGGSVGNFGTCGVAALDELIAAQVAADLARGMAPEVVRQNAKALARENRKLMNRPGGYWILDLSGEGAPHLQLQTERPAMAMDLLLMSDGFYRLVDVYGAYDDAGLLEAATREGLASLYDQVRAIEAGDPECRAYPRNKPRDDAAAVLLRFA